MLMLCVSVGWRWGGRQCVWKKRVCCCVEEECVLFVAFAQWWDLSWWLERASGTQPFAHGSLHHHAFTVWCVPLSAATATTCKDTLFATNLRLSICVTILYHRQRTARRPDTYTGLRASSPATIPLQSIYAAHCGLFLTLESYIAIFTYHRSSVFCVVKSDHSKGQSEVGASAPAVWLWQASAFHRKLNSPLEQGPTTTPRLQWR